MFSRVLTLFAAGLIALASLGADPALAQDAASAPPVAAQEAAPAAPAAAVGTETKENPYGLMNLIKNGHAVDQIVLGILLFMSAGSWFITFTKLWDQHKIGKEVREAREVFFKKASLADGVKALPEGSAVRYIAQTAVEAGDHHEGTLTENIDRNTWGPGLPGHRGLDQPVRRPVRHRLGHLQRADRHRHQPARPRSTRWPARWARR
jgi:biopolymer transport protein ExbB